MQARAVDFAWHAHIVPLAATAAARGGPNADQVMGCNSFFSCSVARTIHCACENGDVLQLDSFCGRIMRLKANWEIIALYDSDIFSF